MSFRFGWVEAVILGVRKEHWSQRDLILVWGSFINIHIAVSKLRIVHRSQKRLLEVIRGSTLTLETFDELLSSFTRASIKVKFDVASHYKSRNGQDYSQWGKSGVEETSWVIELEAQSIIIS